MDLRPYGMWSIWTEFHLQVATTVKYCSCIHASVSTVSNNLLQRVFFCFNLFSCQYFAYSMNAGLKYIMVYLLVNVLIFLLEFSIWMHFCNTEKGWQLFSLSCHELLPIWDMWAVYPHFSFFILFLWYLQLGIYTA